MSLTPEHELTVRRALAAKADLAAEIGFVLPAPVDFTDKSDFWASVAPKSTRQQLETTPVKFCAIYPLLSVDLPENGQSEPLIDFTYEFYLFHEKNRTRRDESDAPEEFGKKLLKTHSDFVAAWLNLRAEFLGRQQLNLGLEFAVAQTNSLVQLDDIKMDAKCDFVPGIRGYELRLRLLAKILLKQC